MDLSDSYDANAAQRLALIGAAAAGALIVAISARAFVIGSVAGGWIYPYFRGFTPWLLLPGLVGSLGLLLVVRLALRLLDRAEPIAVSVMVAAGFVLQLLLRVFALAPLGAIVRSDRANGFYSPALRYGIGEFLSAQARLAAELPPHARTNMPGKVILFRLLSTIASTPRGVGMLIVLLSVLGAVGVYLVTRELTADRRSALFATAVYLVLPGRIVFLPIANTVTPLVVLVTFWLFLRALRSASVGASVWFGGALFVLVLFEPLPLVTGLIFLGALWQAFRHDGKRIADYWPAAAAAVGTFFGAYLLTRFATSYDLFANLAYMIGDARTFNAVNRPYSVWIVSNLAELAVATGAAVTAIFLGAFAVREWRAWTSPINVFSAMCLVTIVVVDLLGLNRGEVTRLWIFLAAFVAVAVGRRLAASPALLPLALVIIACATQASVEAGMVGFVIP